LILHNASASTLTLSNQSGSEATAANQIITGTGADLSVPTNTSVTMQYDGTASRWRITGSSNSANTLAAGSTGQVQFNGGTNLAADSNLFWDNTNKRLGIGTATAPVNKLDVYGGVAIGTSYAGVSTAPTNGAIIQGNVGIGTTTPASIFHLSSAANTTETITSAVSGGGTLGQISFLSSRGSIATPAGVSSGDVVGKTSYQIPAYQPICPPCSRAMFLLCSLRWMRGA
jgi:hypothetical protein